MTKHCKCRACKANLGSRTYETDVNGLAEEVRGGTVDPKLGGYFVHGGSSDYTSLKSVELFQFKSGGCEREKVGVSGFWFASAPGPEEMKAYKATFGRHPEAVYPIPLTAENSSRVFLTRGGAQVRGAELTWIVGHGGSINLETGLAESGLENPGIGERDVSKGGGCGCVVS